MSSPAFAIIPHTRCVRQAARVAAIALSLFVSVLAHAHGDRAHGASSPSPTASASAAPAARTAPLVTYTGRVDALTVIDRTTGRAHRYPRLRLADGTRLQLD